MGLFFDNPIICVLGINTQNAFACQEGAVQQETEVEKIIRRIRGGVPNLSQRLLVAIGRARLLIPTSLKFESGDELGTVRVKVSTLIARGCRELPVFCSQSAYVKWSKGYFKPFPVLGADLIDMLDSKTYIILNPASSCSLTLSPFELERIRRMAIKDIAILDTSHQIVKMGKKSGSGNKSEVEDSLGTILPYYPDISEAYYFPSVSEECEGVLGIMAGNLEPEVRYNLISDVAEIARDIYGEAGAIYVYDDLHIPGACSQRLFEGLSPFYIKDRVQITHSATPRKNTLANLLKRNEFHAIFGLSL